MELFCGIGGLANGFSQACAELGLRHVSDVAVDQDAEAVAVYQANHDTRIATSDSVSSLVDFQVRGTRESARFLYEPELVKQGWNRLVGSIDVVLAGPPCQGHSNLNNRSRRTDRRNELYLTVPAIAMAVGAPIIVIENVPAIVHDSAGVVAATISLLEHAGYHLTSGMLHAAKMGWPQTRSRHFLVAHRDALPRPLHEVAADLADEPRDLYWAIGDLEDAEDDIISEPTELSPENRRRIDWLFDNKKYDLDLPERPVCHQEETRYLAVYGRLRYKKPAPTITTGFVTPGRGRYIHPVKRRVLNYREAARLQGFPDTYRFRAEDRPEPAKRSAAKWIGDAVPMPLGYAASIAALAGASSPSQRT